MGAGQCRSLVPLHLNLRHCQAVCSRLCDPALNAYVLQWQYSLILHSLASVVCLLQCCLSSGVGQEAAVAALASCPPALQQLVLLMSARGTVLTAAAGQQQHEPATELVRSRP